MGTWLAEMAALLSVLWRKATSAVVEALARGMCARRYVAVAWTLERISVKEASPGL